MIDQNLAKKERDIYVIITNSLQNDFLERGYEEEFRLTSDDLVVDYKTCEEMWINLCDDEQYNPTEEKTSERKNEIAKLIEKIRNDIKKEGLDDISTGISYHKFLEKYCHRVHIEHGESERLWETQKLERFIEDMMESGSKAYNNMVKAENLDKEKSSDDAPKNENMKAYYFIHLRDWHDPTDPLQQDESRHFGCHCVKGTHGAKFIDPLESYIKECNEFNTIINSNSYSSFTDTNLKSVLESIMTIEDSSREKVKIGIFGVITNIKILLLTFELSTIHKFKNVYICKDLCAGFNHKGHIDGIEYIRSVFGVKTLDQREFRNEFEINQKPQTPS